VAGRPAGWKGFANRRRHHEDVTIRVQPTSARSADVTECRLSNDITDGSFDDIHILSVIQLEMPPQLRHVANRWLERDDSAGRANTIAEQQRVDSNVGADVEHDILVPRQARRELHLGRLVSSEPEAMNARSDDPPLPAKGSLEYSNDAAFRDEPER